VELLDVLKEKSIMPRIGLTFAHWESSSVVDRLVHPGLIRRPGLDAPVPFAVYSGWA